MTEIPASARLVLACGRVHAGSEEREAIAQACAHAVDWDEALALALRHGLAPLLHRHLSAIAPRSLPKPVAAALWARAESVARRNDAMAAELCRVLDALDAQRVQAIPFKGPLLTLELYGELGLREFGDLDLLMSREDIVRAKHSLAALGYQPLQALAPDAEAGWMRSPRCYEMPLADVRRGFMVELQWRADPGIPIPRAGDAAGWQQMPRCDFLGRRVFALPAVENLLALLVHGSKHAWSNLGWLVDISEVARSGNTDWQRLLGAARLHGAMRRVALGLDLAHRLLEAPLPPEVLAFVAEARIARTSEATIPGLLSRAYRHPGMAASLRTQLQLLDTRRQRALHLAVFTLTPGFGDWQRWRLPPKLAFLPWVLRPLRLAEKYGSPRRFLP